MLQKYIHFIRLKNHSYQMRLDYRRMEHSLLGF